MKKRVLGLTLALALMAGGAKAAVLTSVPGTPTQDGAVSLSAVWQSEGKDAYALESCPADQLTMDMVEDAYAFVFEEGNRPVRWYPEEAQRAIEALAGAGADELRMTEFFRLHAPEAEQQADLQVTMKLDVAYQPGQTVVVMLGDASDAEKPVWTVLEAQVTQDGQVELTLPQALMAQLQGKDVLLSVLASKAAPAADSSATALPGGEQGTAAEATAVPGALPSKQASDTTRIEPTLGRDGQALQDDFELAIVPETEEISREMALLAQHVTQAQQSALSWLPQDAQSRIRYLLGAEADGLIVSDYVTLVARDFRPTDGGAVGTFSFATPYQEGQTIVTALGLPRTDAAGENETRMNWTVQPATVRQNGRVDVVFDQLALADMGQETGVLLVLSQPTNESK